MQEQNAQAAVAEEVTPNAINIVAANISADHAEIQAGGDVHIGNRINVNVDPSTQERAAHFLRAEQGLKHEEKESQVNNEKRALAKWFLRTLPHPLQDSLPRLNFMQQLDAGFQAQAQKKVAPIQVIYGMGGVGKTQLAISYANEHTHDKDFVVWIYADKIQLDGQWLVFGEKLLGRALKGIPRAEQLQLIQDALHQQEHWLIVLDNLESKTALEGLLPNRRLPTQQVLITTRSEHWGNLSCPAHILLHTRRMSNLHRNTLKARTVCGCR